MTWLVMQRSVWSDIVSWQKSLHNNSTQHLLQCIDDHHFKEEEMKSVGELSHVCSQIVLHTAGLLSRTFKVKNTSNSLTYTIASSCVCTSPLAVMTVVGLHDFVKVPISSITQVFFADHVHRRSRVHNGILVLQVQELMQAGTYFPKVRRMLLFDAPFNLTHFWPVSTLLRGHLALATLSPPEIESQILERWGCADEVHLGKYIRAKDFGFEF